MYRQRAGKCGLPSGRASINVVRQWSRHYNQSSAIDGDTQQHEAPGESSLVLNFRDSLVQVTVLKNSVNKTVQ